MLGGKITIAAIASTISALIAIVGTNWFNAAKLNVDQANLAMRYVEFAQGPSGGTPPSLQDKVFVMRAMASAGFGELAMQARDEALEVRSRITAEQLNQPVHPTLNIGIPGLTVGQLESVIAIVNVFERASPVPDYGPTSWRPGEVNLGYLSLSDGGVGRVLEAYVASDRARFAGALTPFLDRVRQRDMTLAQESAFLSALDEAAADPVMQSIQTRFALELWRPAFAVARDRGLREPLSYAIVYDSFVHGSWARLHDQTASEQGPLTAENEKAWMLAYVRHRRAWLADHSNQLVNRMAYRMDTMIGLIEADNWQLTPPFYVRLPGGHGISIEASTLRSSALVRANTEAILLEFPQLSGSGPGFFERNGATVDAMFGGGGN